MGIKRFNILHVVSRLPIGGVENMLFKIVTGYSKERFNPVVCCIKEGGIIADILKESGYKVEVLNRMRGHGFDIGAIIELYRIIRREEIHILRTHQYHANLYGRIAGILAGVPVMIPSFHSLYTSPHMPKLHRRLLNHILSHFSDKLVAVSDAVARDMIRFDRIKPEKVMVINNGVAIEGFNCDINNDEAKRRLNIPNNGVVVGTVGRLKEEKGHRFLIEGLSKLSGITLAIAGGGPLLEELKVLSERLKVNAVFMGEISPYDVPVFLKAIDIFCFPSLWEGFSTALVEAMASGLPIIASDIPSHREVLDDAGIFVPLRDPDALARAIRMLIDNPSMMKVLSKRAETRANLFSIERTVKAYEELFEDSLRAKGVYEDI